MIMAEGGVMMEMRPIMAMVANGGMEGGAGRRGLEYVRGTLTVTGTTDRELSAQCFRLNSDWTILGLGATELEAAP